MEGIGYNVLRISDGVIDLKPIPFGQRRDNGMVESFSSEVIDEIYCQYLGVDGVEDYSSYIYNLDDSIGFHVGVPTSMIGEKPLWKDIMNADTFIMTLVIDEKPQVLNEEGILMAVNMINIMKRG